MTTRDGFGLIQQSALPPLTSIQYIYPCYGQSNSNGTSAGPPVCVSDPTFGAARVFGQDGRATRNGGTVWCDLAVDNVNPVGPANTAYKDFSGFAATEADEPLRSVVREVFLYRIADILNQRQIAATGQRHRALFATLGQGGYLISQLVKGTQAYANLLSAVTRMTAIAVSRGLTAVVPAIPYVQGEADFASSGSGYAAVLAQLQADLETDIQAITGQAQAIPLVITQQSNFGTNAGAGGTILYPVLDQLQAHISNPGKVVLSGPMYAGENLSSSNLHFAGFQTIRRASVLGNALAQIAVNGGIWEPIRPQSVGRSGNLVDVQFHVPSGPLVLDTAYVANTSDGFYGFDFRQTGGTTTLQSVTVLNANTLRFTLSGAPDGTSPKLRAGRSSGAGAVVSGPRTGPRTCLRDQASADPRFCNWAVHFDVTVP